jgi:hypothetical protein
MSGMKRLIILALFVSALCVSCGNHSTATPQSGNSPPAPAETQKTDSAQLSEVEKVAFLKEFDERLDVLIGTELRTKALANDLINWYQINPEHPTAVRETAQLCEWKHRMAEAMRNLSAISQNHDKEIVENNRLTAMTESLKSGQETMSKMRQLEAMGWSCRKQSEK